MEEGEEKILLGDEPVDWIGRPGPVLVEFRLERERVRSRELDTLQHWINNPNVSKEAKPKPRTSSWPCRRR